MGRRRVKEEKYPGSRKAGLQTRTAKSDDKHVKGVFCQVLSRKEEMDGGRIKLVRSVHGTMQNV